MGEPDGIDWPHPDDLKPPQYGTGMHFPHCIHHDCTGCLPPLDDLAPRVDEAPASPFFGNGDRADSTSPDDLNRPIVKYDGNGQPMRADDPRLGNRAQRRAMAREARRRR